MEFDKSRIYTSVNADELKVGFIDKAIVVIGKHKASANKYRARDAFVL